eukprot:1136477-Pelagomonas_calceolata.AAC.2
MLPRLPGQRQNFTSSRQTQGWIKGLSGSSSESKHILHTQAGCGGNVREYSRYGWNDTEKASKASVPLNICLVLNGTERTSMANRWEEDQLQCALVLAGGNACAHGYSSKHTLEDMLKKTR